MNCRVLFACVLLLAACADDSEGQRLANAKAQLAKKDLNAAVIELKGALDSHPQSAALRLLLGRTFLQQGDAASATQELDKAQEAGAADADVVPDLARAWLALGEHNKLIARFAKQTLSEPAANAALQVALAEAYRAQGDSAAARAALLTALKSQPTNADAVVSLARLDAAEGHSDVALNALNALLQSEPGHAAAGLAKGEILMQSPAGMDAALQAVRQVRAANPSLVAGHVALVELLLQQRKASEARASFEDLRKLAPQHPSTLALQARLAFDAGDYTTSLDISQRLLAVAPNHPGMLLLAGATQFQLRHYTLAEDLLAKALKAAPGFRSARLLLAQAFLRDGQPGKTLEVLQAASEVEQADSASLLLRGEAHLQLDDNPRAQAAFDRARQVAPNDPGVQTSLALARLGSLGEGSAGAPALDDLERIARGDKGSQADLALVNARLKARDFKGALQAVDGLQKKLPDQPLPWSLRGRVLLAQGDSAGAAASFEKALALQPNHLPALVALSNLNAQAGRAEPARARLQALLKLEPRNVSARLAQASLESRLGAPESVVTALLREAVRIDPLQVVSQRALIEHLQSTGDHAAALEAARGAAGQLPQDPGVQELLGTAQLAAGDSQQAAVTFKKLMAQQPTLARHAVHLADATMTGGDPAAAAAALKQALAIEPENAMAVRGLALLAVMDHRQQEGVDMARAQQKRHPKDAAGFALEGELQGRAGRWAEAATAYAAALQRASSSAVAINLHKCLSLAGKSAEANRLALDWQKANPLDAAFAFYMGDTASAARDWAGAEAQYRNVLRLQPRHAAAINNIAWLLVMQHKPGAVAMAEQANALLADRAPFLDTLAQALDAEDQSAKALTVQRRAVALRPRDPALRLRLAQLQLKQGDKADARKELQALAELGDRFAGQAQVAQLLKGL